MENSEVQLRTKKIEENKNAENGEVLFGFNFDIKKGEYEEEYLSRLNLAIYEQSKKENKTLKGKYKGKDSDSSINLNKNGYYHIFNKEKYNSCYEKAFRNLLKKTSEKEVLDHKGNGVVIDEINVNTLTKPYATVDKIKNDFDSLDYFNSTIKKRSFLPESFKKDAFPFAMSLFEVYNIQSIESIQYLQSKINNKNICLLGGGKSVIDLVMSNELKPNMIVNIDPYLDYEGIKTNLNKNYQSLNLKADSPNLLDQLQKESIGQFDEMWASYSVPYYNKNKEEIINLFNNIDLLLAPGGNCRITPLSAQNEECASEVLKQVAKLKETNRYNLHLLDDTLILHKLNTENDKRIDLDRKEEEGEVKEKIDTLRKQICL